MCIACDNVTDHRVLVVVGSKSVCICQDGYFQDPVNSANKVCLACIAGCLTCTNTKICDVCNSTGNYLLVPSKVCKNCGVGCGTCNDNGTCTACKKGYFYNTTTTACQLTCADYFFGNTKNNVC